VAIAIAALLGSGLLGGPVSAQSEDPGSISGRVTDERGVPLQDVCVGVDWLLRPFSNATLVRTDVLGRYTVADVAPGLHFVTFNVCDDPLAGHAGAWWPDSPGLLDAQPVHVEPGTAASGIDISLGAAGTITGTITDEAMGEPLAQACVTALDRQTIAFAQTRSAEDGQYALPALAPGAYVVAFTDCSAPQHHISEAFDDVAVPELLAGQEPTVISVAAGDEHVVDAALGLGGAVTGSVTAAHTGRPVPLACVALVDAASEESWGVYAGQSSFTQAGDRTDDDRYTVGGVPAGNYQVQFLGQGCTSEGYREAWYGGAQHDSADILQVRADTTLEGIDAKLHPVASIQMACSSVETGGFSDIDPSNPHAYAIGCLTASEVVAGKSPSRYAPAGHVRRDQMASFLARTLTALGFELPSNPTDRFNDDNGNVHENSINQLADLGIITGTGPEQYGPAVPVTRGQMATLLSRTYESATTHTLRSTRDWFADDTASPHHGRINHAATAGIASGVAPRRFAPGGIVRRDQVASFLARTIDRATRDTLHLRLPSQTDATAPSDEADQTLRERHRAAIAATFAASALVER
jgi:hypothetical protein